MVSNLGMVVHPAQTAHIKKMAEANGKTLKDLTFKQYSRLADNFSRMANKEALSKNGNKILEFLKKNKKLGVVAAAAFVLTMFIGGKKKEAAPQPQQQLNVAA